MEVDERDGDGDGDGGQEPKHRQLQLQLRQRDQSEEGEGQGQGSWHFPRYVGAPPRRGGGGKVSEREDDKELFAFVTSYPSDCDQEPDSTRGFAFAPIDRLNGLNGGKSKIEREKREGKEDEVTECESCGEIFSEWVAYELHYAARHTHQCALCDKTFTTERLLSIHVEERHDTYFAARLAAREQRRGAGGEEREKLLRCLAAECPENFATRRARRRHMIRDHCFPENFQISGIEDGKERLKREKKEGGSGNQQENGAVRCEASKREPKGMEVEEGAGRDEKQALATQVGRKQGNNQMDIDDLSRKFSKQMNLPLGYGALRTSKRNKPKSRLAL